jgi:GNAT superfamily N-acetyltransferase
MASSEQPSSPLLRGLQPGDLGWIVSRHGELYAAEYGWNSRIEVLAASELAAFAERDDREHERAFIAELDGRRAGSVLCTRRAEDVAQLRMLFVEPDARGHGIGMLLIDQCVGFARAAGYSSMLLWTTSALTSARRLYERAGFELFDEQSFSEFGPELVGEYWGRALQAP